jgi:hypothetical protein
VQRTDPAQRALWILWERWISEIVADLWAVSRVGIAATLGLIGVVSLPRAFVFRVNVDDPHPAPWIRVLLSCALGQALYPHPQWGRTAALWKSLYPVGLAAPGLAQLLTSLETTFPKLVAVLLAHRPAALRGRSLADAMRAAERQPGHLAALLRAWHGSPTEMRDHPPTLVFAAIGQARADGVMTPEEESRLLAYLLTYWALRSTLDIAEVCAASRPRRSWRSAPIPMPTALAAV